jgi:hypothetical protein
MRSSLVACLLTLMWSTALSAPAGGSVKPESQDIINFGTDITVGIDLSAQRQHQIFQDSSADIDTLSLLPYLQTGNWLFTLDLPWQHARGEYFVIGEQPSPRLVCRVSGTVLQSHPRFARYVSNNCQPLTTATSAANDASGVGDVVAFARYGVPLDNLGIWLGSVGVGYQADTGDVDKGLGSGVRDVMLEGSADARIGKFSVLGVAGYAWIVGGDAAQGTDDYLYMTFSLGYRVLRWLALRAAWDYQQAYTPGGADVQAATASVGFRPVERLRLHFYAKDYFDAAAYPDREYGGYVTWPF